MTGVVCLCMFDDRNENLYTLLNMRLSATSAHLLIWIYHWPLDRMCKERHNNILRNNAYLALHGFLFLSHKVIHRKLYIKLSHRVSEVSHRTSLPSDCKKEIYCASVATMNAITLFLESFSCSYLCTGISRSQTVLEKLFRLGSFSYAYNFCKWWLGSLVNSECKDNKEKTKGTIKHR